MDVVASLAYGGFSYRNQTISELSAYGAPTRTFWVVFGTAYGVLELAFAVGIWKSADRSRALRGLAGLFALHAIMNLTLGPFSSMHRREVLAADGATFSDTLHLAMVGAGGVIFLLQSAFASAKFGARFRLYSLATVLLTLVFGLITSSYADEVQANEPTPWLGIYERVSAYVYMLWIVVLSVALLRADAAPRVEQEGKGRWQA
jgi:hypothetical protein